ncbi:helix-turn-helix domain-containing protein [Citricoccus nitrophenolicus]
MGTILTHQDDWPHILLQSLKSTPKLSSSLISDHHDSHGGIAMEEDQLYRPGPTAEYLGSTVNTLAYWRYVGQGPAFIKIGRNVSYRGSDVKAWLQAQTRTRTGEHASA